MPAPPPRPRGLVYIHVPKCGGSSFGATLRLRYFWSHATITLDQGDPALSGEARILSDYDARRAQLGRLLQQGPRLITGHVRYDPRLHGPAGRDYDVVTLLRDPVARFLSHYRYLQRRHPDPDRPDRLEVFLASRDARRLASQYLFYFAGQSQTEMGDPAPAIRRAIRNLQRFKLVGDLTRPRDFQRALSRIVSAPLPLWRRNAAPGRATVPPDLRHEIRALCAADIAIYESCAAGAAKAAA